MYQIEFANLYKTEDDKLNWRLLLRGDNIQPFTEKEAYERIAEEMEDDAYHNNLGDFVYRVIKVEEEG